MWLIQNQGAIAHLNMGEGKTRTIMPMLVLYWSELREGIVRLHILKQLLSEGYSFLHRHLTNSVLCKKIMLLPFHRNVELTFQGSQILHGALKHCIREGGTIVISPEQRLSMLLKYDELCLFGDDEAKQTSNTLEAVNKLPTYNLYDESDEILRYRYKLVYAAGAKISLPFGPKRWGAVQALLRVLKMDPNVRKFVKKFNEKHALIWEQSESPEAFEEMRLLPGPQLQSTVDDLNKLVAQALCRKPPRELFWLKDHDGQGSRFSDFLLGNSMDVADLDCSEDRQQDLFVLRGLLGHGVLCHSLSQRFRINFGIDTRGGRKRLAVPFRANDTPSERAEFGHQDAAITLTHLAYYY